MRKSDLAKNFTARSFAFTGLEASEHPGLAEIFDYQARTLIPDQIRNMPLSRAQIAVDIRHEHQDHHVRMIQAFHQGFYDSVDDIDPAVYCAMLGFESLFDNRWKTADARDARRIYNLEEDIEDNAPETYRFAETSVQFLFQIALLRDLIVANAHMMQHPAALKPATLRTYAGKVRTASLWRSHLPDTPLADAIKYAHTQTAGRLAALAP